MPARLTFDELHQLKWLIGGLLTLLSIWALGGLDLISFGLNSIMMMVICFALLKPGWVHAIPELFWSRFIVPLILILALVDFGLGFTNLVSPLMRMVILLLVYRMLAPRNQREDLQLLLLSLFGIIVSGAITVSLLFAVQIFLFTPVAMAFLLIVCLLDRGTESANYRPGWEQFSLRRLIRRAWRAIEIRVLVLCGLLFVFVVTLSTGFFILIPRFDLGQTIPFMQMETKPRSGFSDTVSLNSVSKIIEDRSIALRIDVPNLESISSLPYWRILVLDRYRGGEFSLSDEMIDFSNYAKLRELSDWTKRQVPLKIRKREQWTFYFEGGVSQYLPLPTMFQTLRFTKEHSVKLLPDLHVIGLDAVQKSTFYYQIEDLAWDVRAPASDLENEALDQHAVYDNSENGALSDYPLTTLDLPLNEDEQSLLSKLNSELVGNTGNLSTAEYSERVTSYLRENYRYSLNPDSIGGLGDPIVNWIDAGSAGHCELFAGAFILLARQAGYPARMVVGFVGGSWNAVEEFFVVRNSDAHAWAEIYDAETEEWLRVDPTPGGSAINPEIALPVDFEVETGMWAWVDSLRMQWYRRIVSFDQDDQLEMATSLIDFGDSLLKEFSSSFKELLASLKGWFSQPFSRESLLRTGAILGVCFVLYYLWRTFFSWSELFLRLFRRDSALSHVRRQAARYMVKVRIKIGESGTDEVDAEVLQKLYSQLEALRFGPRTSLQVATPIFRKARSALRRSRVIRL